MWLKKIVVFLDRRCSCGGPVLALMLICIDDSPQPHNAALAFKVTKWLLYLQALLYLLSVAA